MELQENVISMISILVVIYVTYNDVIVTVQYDNVITNSSASVTIHIDLNSDLLALYNE